MARPKKDATLDLTQAIELTAGAIERLSCPPGKSQAFLRDSKSPGLRVRVTSNGAKSFVFEGKLNRKTIRRTIGDIRAWPIEAARTEANKLRVTLDGGLDPREIERQAEVERVQAAMAAKESDRLANLTVAQAWATYLSERKPHWGDRHYADHIALTHEGGLKRARMPGCLTKPGPLAPLMNLRLSQLNSAVVEAWAAKEAADRPTRTRLSLRLLKAFLSWAESETDFKAAVDGNAAAGKRTREAVGRAKPKNDVLERGQLSAWFEHVRNLPNPVTSAYLQTLLLTGARPGEVLGLRWDDLDPQWMSMFIGDKVEDGRTLPLTPYVWHLLSNLPRRNEWVFPGGRALVMSPEGIQRRQRRQRKLSAEGLPHDTPPAPPSSASGRLIEPRSAHKKACKAAGIQGLTLHGLRRSFSTLTEWLEIPAGVVAQLQGHKPSATAEKHYKRRPLDLLRVHHERIEAWILDQAGVTFMAKALPNCQPHAT